MEDKLVALEFSGTETEANIARGFLEANGITVYVFDNDPAHYCSFRTGTNRDFAIRLMVNSADLEKAQKLLKGDMEK